MRCKNFVLVCLVAISMTSVASAQEIFSEDWDDGNGGMRWSAPIPALETPALGFDGTVDYAFDYSMLGAASAPNSTGGTTIGAAFETNTTDSPGDEGEGVAIVPLAGLADIPAGDFVLNADVYMFWNGTGGSTEYATLGVHSGGTASPLRFGLDDGDGLAWQFDGDGDSSTDILRYEDPGAGETSIGEYEDIPDGSIPGVVTCDPSSPNGPNPCGGSSNVGPVNQWVEMEIESVNGLVSLSMNGFVLDTFDNTGGGLANGTIMIGGSDPFNSVNNDNPGTGLSNYQVFDNVVLTAIPEPTSFVLLGLAGMSLLGMRRR